MKFYMWVKIALLILYALILISTPFVSYDHKTRTLISISELIIRYRPFSRYVAGCAAWAMFLILQGVENTTSSLSYLCWLCAHGILCFDADTHIAIHIGMLVLFIASTLLIAIMDNEASPSTQSLCAASGTFTLMLLLNIAVFKWRYTNEQNILELIWLGMLCWKIYEI